MFSPISKILVSLLLMLLILKSVLFLKNKNTEEKLIVIENPDILHHIVNLKKQNLNFYWKDANDVNFKNFGNLKKTVNTNQEKLIFAMNGGMYKKDLSPQGLFIENGVIKTKIDTLQKSYGNFYMQPNGVFYITNNKKGTICKTTHFKNHNIKFATQSGPLLLIDGEIHSKFKIGNGVGILPNNNMIFAMSKQKINFYDFATYFKNLGCKNALYLDGFVSKTYLPEKNWHSLNGNFGVIIAETKKE